MFRRSGSALSLIVIFIIIIFCASNIRWGKDRWIKTVEADAYAYYAYLPAIFIYQDLNFRFIEGIEAKYQTKNISGNYDFRQEINGHKINKYYCGTAVALLPFFTVAHLLTGAFGYDPDGFSKLYMVFISLGAFFYLLVGLVYLWRLLEPLQLKEWHKALLLFAAVFGTNVFYYVINEPGMSHTYSFAFITMFVYYSYQYFRKPKLRQLLLMAALLGIITLIRPINILAFFLIFFASGNLENLKQGFIKAGKNFPAILGCLLIFGLILGLQFGYYKLAAGNWLVYSYGQESFNFLDPHFFDILFSYKKGLFLYTPLFFISLAGTIFLWQQNRFEFYSLIGFLILLTYFLSSWWSWWYGGSFSGRPFLEFSFIFLYFLALALKKLTGYLKKANVVAIIFLIMVCQFQTYQYRKGYIHWEEMTKEKYWAVFLNPTKLLR